MRIVTSAIAILLSTALSAQSTITNESGEKWWGLPTTYQGTTVARSDYGTAALQTNTLVSSKGRYIYTDNCFGYRISEQNIDILSDQDVKVLKSGKSMRDATLLLGQKMGMNNLFNSSLEPVYIASCGLYTLENFASSNLTPGVIIIRDWQKREGTFEFESQKLINICQTLSRRGFSPVLEISQLLSGDTPQALESVMEERLINSSDGSPIVMIHKGGFSLMYDLTSESGASYINAKVKEAMEISGAKGVYLNYVDVTPMGEISTSKGGGLEKLAIDTAKAIDNLLVTNTTTPDLLVTHPIADTEPIKEMIKVAISAPYAGVRRMVAIDSEAALATKLYYARLFMPTYEVVITDNFASEIELYRNGEELRASIDNALKEAIIERQKTGAPVIRHMEYEFPAKGFSNCLDQYMIGSRYLVAPHTSDEDRMVRLPTGKWRDCRGNVIKGPMVISAPQSDKIPYYERVKK